MATPTRLTPNTVAALSERSESNGSLRPSVPCPRNLRNLRNLRKSVPEPALPAPSAVEGSERSESNGSPPAP